MGTESAVEHQLCCLRNQVWSEHRNVFELSTAFPLPPKASENNTTQYNEQGSWRSFNSATLPGWVLLGEAPNHFSLLSSRESSSLPTTEVGLHDYGGPFTLWSSREYRWSWWFSTWDNYTLRGSVRPTGPKTSPYHQPSMVHDIPPSDTVFLWGA